MSTKQAQDSRFKIQVKRAQGYREAIAGSSKPYFTCCKSFLISMQKIQNNNFAKALISVIYLAKTALTRRNRQSRSKLTKLAANPVWYFPVKMPTTAAKGTVDTTSKTNHDLKYLQMTMKLMSDVKQSEKSHFLS